MGGEEKLKICYRFSEKTRQLKTKTKGYTFMHRVG